ncbi:degenerin-like protein asic-1 [Penaeus indicus]|uniref:degenerin-like protein asic-1 n=1 Tax=Penaeus indicus TaxID=29960 RepID=UPI00300C47D3
MITITNMTKYERLGEPHGVCANDYGFDHPYKYSRKLCKQLCVEREFRERCGCFIGQNPLYDTLETVPEDRCSFVDRKQVLCMASVTKSIEEETIQCDCQLPCSEMMYDTQVTTSKPNAVYYNILSQTRKQLQSLCTNESQMVSLLVYLDSKSYTVTEESPAYSWDTLLSNIGGSLGLFVGVSLISILEVFEMIIDVIFAGFKRCTGGGKKVSHKSAEAWQGKIDVVEMDRQDKKYKQFRKELEIMVKDIVQDLSQNESSGIRVQPNSANSGNREGLDASRMFNMLFQKHQ